MARVEYFKNRGSFEEILGYGFSDKSLGLRGMKGTRAGSVIGSHLLAAVLWKFLAFVPQ